MAKGIGFTGVPYPSEGVDSFAAAPAMTTAVSEPVASSSTYTGIRESMPHRYAEDYHRRATGVDITGMHGCAAPPDWLYHASTWLHLSEWPTGPWVMRRKEQGIRKILKQVHDAVGDTRSSLRSHCSPSG